MSTRHLSGLVALLLAFGPGGCGDAVERAPEAQEEEAALPSPAPVQDGVSTWLQEGAVDSAALERWLQAKAWKRWDASPSIKPTPQGGSRVFLNPLLAGSVMEGATSHPLGAVAIRELYEDDLRTPRAINLLVKLEDDGGDGSGWLWVEQRARPQGPVISVEEPAAPRCVGCHAAAKDQIQSGWPLR